jgi:23S rRNA pseudouridine2605 synthase
VLLPAEKVIFCGIWVSPGSSRFQPMSVTLDRQQGANAWLTIGLREGKNREIRRAMEAIGLTVNRLLRISYGPFRLGELKQGEVEEVRPRVLREQLGLEQPGEGKQAKAGAKKPVRRRSGPPRPARSTPKRRG